MNWTEPKPPTKDVSYYDHTTLETPIGQFKIEWKSWKEHAGFSIFLDDNYITEGDDLEDAKDIVFQHLVRIHKELELIVK